MRPPTHRFALLAFVFFVGASVLAAAAPHSTPLAGRRVLWLGDSITQANPDFTFAKDGVHPDAAGHDAATKGGAGF